MRQLFAVDPVSDEYPTTLSRKIKIKIKIKIKVKIKVKDNE